MSEPQISTQQPIPALYHFDVEGVEQIEDVEAEDSVPELESGDRLKWAEFARRFGRRRRVPRESD